MHVDALPWDFDATVFRCAWEYPVVDYAAEVAFHTAVMGLETLADDGDYALLASPGREFTYAVRRVDGVQPNLDGHRLTLMTRNIEAFAAVLLDRIAIERFQGSAVQTVLRVVSPAGLVIDIWEFPDNAVAD